MKNRQIGVFLPSISQAETKHLIGETYNRRDRPFVLHVCVPIFACDFMEFTFAGSSKLRCEIIFLWPTTICDCDFVWHFFFGLQKNILGPSVRYIVGRFWFVAVGERLSRSFSSRANWQNGGCCASKSCNHWSQSGASGLCSAKLFIWEGHFIWDILFFTYFLFFHIIQNVSPEKEILSVSYLQFNSCKTCLLWIPRWIL